MRVTVLWISAEAVDQDFIISAIGAKKRNTQTTSWRQWVSHTLPAAACPPCRAFSTSLSPWSCCSPLPWWHGYCRCLSWCVSQQLLPWAWERCWLCPVALQGMEPVPQWPLPVSALSHLTEKFWSGALYMQNPPKVTWGTDCLNGLHGSVCIVAADRAGSPREAPVLFTSLFLKAMSHVDVNHNPKVFLVSEAKIDMPLHHGMLTSLHRC